MSFDPDASGQVPAAERASRILARFVKGLRAILLTSDEEWGQTVRKAMQGNPEVTIQQVTTRPEDLVETIRAWNPDMVLIDNDLAGRETGMAVAERVIRAFPKLHVYVASGSADMALRNAALARGVRDVIKKPFTPQELVAVVATALEQEREAQARLEAGGDRSAVWRPSQTVTHRLIAVGGGKGGTGKTQVAGNLAMLAQLNQVTRLQAVVADMDRGGGSIGMLLKDLPQEPNLLDWIPYVTPDGAPLDPGVVESRLTYGHEKTGLRMVFDVPDSYHDYDAVDEHTVRVMLNTLRLMYAVTVVDCPPTNTAPGSVAMEQASTILVVTDPDPASFKKTIRFLADLERDQIDTSKVQILFNRVNPRLDVSLSDAAEIFRGYAQCAVWLPDDDAVRLTRKAFQLTVQESPDCPWSRALRKLAADLMPGLGFELGGAGHGGTRHFYCSGCYIEAGSPRGVAP